MKRVVNSLKPEFDGRITFLIASLNTQEGRLFADSHNVSRVTLIFFSPDGTKINSLTNELDPQNLRNIFYRVFKLKK